MSKNFRKYYANVFVLNSKALKIQHWYFNLVAQQNKNQCKSKTPSQQKSMRSPMMNYIIDSVEKEQEERLIKSQPKTQKPSLKGIKIEQNSIKFAHNQNHVIKGLRIQTPKLENNGIANGNNGHRSVPQSALSKNENGLKPYSLKNVHSQGEINSLTSIKLQNNLLSKNDESNNISSTVPKNITSYSFVSIENELSQLRKLSSKKNSENYEILQQDKTEQKRNQVSLKIDTSKVTQYINQNGYDYPSKSYSRNSVIEENNDLNKFTLTEQQSEEQQNENKDLNKIKKIPRTQQNSPTIKSKTPIIENSKAKMIDKPGLRPNKATHQQIDRKNSKETKLQAKHQRTPTQELRKSPSQTKARKMSDDTLIKKLNQREIPNNTPSFTDRITNQKPINKIEFTHNKPKQIQQRKSNFDIKLEERKTMNKIDSQPQIAKRKSEIKSKQEEKNTQTQQKKHIQRQRGESHEKYLERVLAIKNNSPKKQEVQTTKSVKKQEASYFNFGEDSPTMLEKQYFSVSNDNIEEIKAEMNKFQAVDELSYESLMKQQKQNEELLELSSNTSERSTPRKQRKFNIEPEDVMDNLAPIPQHFLKRNKETRIQNSSEKEKYYQPVKKEPKKRIIEICQLEEEKKEENGTQKMNYENKLVYIFH